MTGARWSLIIIDLDGPAAEDAWAALCAAHSAPARPQTWVVRTGAGNFHLYFTLPATAAACPTRRLWGLWDPWAGPSRAGDWRPHCEVRLLGDHGLAVAPPSRHVVTGRPYEFVDDAHSPRGLARPAPAPAWLLDLKGPGQPRCFPEPARPPSRPRLVPCPTPGAAPPDRDAVLDALGPAKHAIARSLGLRLAAAGPNARGWVDCHAIDREDRHPSATIHHDSGVYLDHRDGTRLSFFDLLCRLDPASFRDWGDALRWAAAGARTA